MSHEDKYFYARVIGRGKEQRKMTELSDLFEHIFHSERNYKARIDTLKALNVKIQEFELKLEQTKDGLQTKKGELAVKNSKLANVEMEVKLRELRKAILQTQKDDIANCNNTLLQSFQGAVSDLTAGRRLFRERVKEFGNCYDLHDSGLKYREEEDKKKMVILQDELILLETEMVEIESYYEDVQKLKEELSDAENELKQERGRGKELLAKELEQKAIIQELKGQKVSSTKAFNNSDMKRLQSELDACKNSPEERKCQDLAKELDELQKECYHKQMKLQMARQSRMATQQNSRNKGSQHTFQPLPSSVAEDSYSEVFIDLVDDEWLEAGELDNGDSEVESIEADWDIDEEELEQSLSLYSSVPNTSYFEHGVAPQKTTSPAESSPMPVALRRKGQRYNDQVRDSRVTPSMTREEASSPFTSNFPRKRPGESIFKAPKAHSQQNSDSSKKAKKVRFQYVSK